MKTLTLPDSAYLALRDAIVLDDLKQTDDDMADALLRYTQGIRPFVFSTDRDEDIKLIKKFRKGLARVIEYYGG